MALANCSTSANKFGFPLNRSRLLLSAAIVSAATSVSAQEQSDGPEVGQLEEIVVTGTRMRGAETPVGSPVLSFDRQRIEDSSGITIDKILKESPQVYNLGVSESSRGQPGGNGNIAFGNSVNLRGLGPFATLVLVDGHRVVSNSRNVDPSIMPVLALERLEIVPDGASAIYGSDAIAGVVNLVPRRFVEGGEVTVRYGDADSYGEHRIGASWGTTWEGGQVFAAIETAERDNLQGADRSFYRGLQPDADYRISQCDPGNIVVDGQNYPIPEGGVSSSNIGSLVPGAANLCEPRLGQDILPSQEYDSFAFTFNQELTDWLEFYADGLYSERTFEFTPAAATGNLTVPSSNAFFVAPQGTNPDSITVEYSFEDDLPLNSSNGRDRTQQVTGGFRFSLPHDWRLEVQASYGENNQTSRAMRGLDGRGSLPEALASSDPATAFDPFGLHRTSDAVLAEISDQMFNVDNDVEFIGTEVRADGSLFELPGGEVLLAAGYERQDLEYHPTTQRGGPDATYRCDPCLVADVDSLDRTVDSYYGELLVPIVGPGNAVTGIESLQLRMAMRYDDYSDVGSTENPQFGVNWSPHADFIVRASYGESFRAPLFSDLYGNSAALFPTRFSDPTRGGAFTEGPFRSGGNPNLEPETATTWTVGFDWVPEAFPGLKFSSTYFEVEYEGLIQQYLGDTNILNREDLFAGTGIVLRDQEAWDFVNAEIAAGTPVFGVLPEGGSEPFVVVDGRPANLGESRTKGFDFDLSYYWSHKSGDYSFSFGGSYLTDYELAVTPNAPLVDLRNVIFSPLKFKSRASLGWSLDRFRARAVLNYVGGYENNLITPSQDVDDYVTVDLNGWVELGNDWTIGVDVTNLFDEDPPYVNLAQSENGGGGFDPTASNPLGRLIGVSLTKKF